MALVAERLSAAGTRCGESRDGIAKSQALLQVAAENEFMEEASVKAVARANGVHRLDRKRGRTKQILAALGNHTVWSALDYYCGNHEGQRLQSVLNAVRASQLAGFSFIREEYIHTFQNGLDVISPKVVGVIVCVERSGKARLFHLREKLGDPGAESSQKKKGG